MPDMERLTDKLREDLADTSEAKAFEQGYTQGKNAARKQIAVVVAAIAIIVGIISIWA